MQRQNITLSLPIDLLQKVKLLAVKRESSVSDLLTRVLEDIVSREEGYEAARLRHKALLETEIDLGTQGSSRWTREELHAR